VWRHVPEFSLAVEKRAISQGSWQRENPHMRTVGHLQWANGWLECGRAAGRVGQMKLVLGPGHTRCLIKAEFAIHSKKAVWQYAKLPRGKSGNMSFYPNVSFKKRNGNNKKASQTKTISQNIKIKIVMTSINILA